MQKVLSHLRRCITDYEMISPGDKICVGVSGGKDSLTLLLGLAQLRRFYPLPFELCAVTLDMGFEGADFSPIAALCESVGVPYTVKKTELAKILFEIRKEQNPCSLCAKMRRGLLHDASKALGCNKVALGHHYDDVIETFFLSLFYEGRVHCFSPVTYLSRKDITLIRPMIYLPEKEVTRFVTKEQIPIVKNPCPQDGVSKRQYIKDHIAALQKEHPGIKKRFFTAVQNSKIEGWEMPAKP